MSINLERPWQQAFSNSTTKLDIYHCFRLILGRQPSEGEWPGHSGFVGKSLPEVVSTYLNSPEFKNRKLTNFVPKAVHRVDLGGYAMYVAENDHAVGGSILTTHTYEPGVSDVFRRLLKPGMTVIDIGANIGWFTMLSAHLVGSAGRVFAIEPGPVNGRFLLLNKAVNHFDQVTLIHAAASDDIQSLAYSSSFSNGFVSDLATATPAEVLDADIVFSLPIDLVVPATLSVDLIKVDVEGWEMKALNGARQIIERCKPWIIAEFTPPALEGFSKVTGEQFLQALGAYGYQFEVIHDHAVVACGSDIAAVMREYERSKSSHIDLLCSIA